MTKWTGKMRAIVLCVLLILASFTAQGTFNLIKLVREPVNPALNIPANWENLLIPSGEQPTFYDYQAFVPQYDWDGNATPKLLWARVYLWLPAQRFCIMSLQPDNTWRETGMIVGPASYHALSVWDGEGKLLRLVAE